MRIFKRITESEKAEYPRSFARDLIIKGLPCIYSGDITEESYKILFKNLKLDKDKEFSLSIGEDIVESISEKFINSYSSNIWCEANGVLFLFRNNMIFVLDYEFETDNTILILE